MIVNIVLVYKSCQSFVKFQPKTERCFIKVLAWKNTLIILYFYFKSYEP